MPLRIFLALAGLSWFGFGVYSWVTIQGLGEATGVIASTTSAAIELRAVYGGMTMGFGLLVAVGAFSTDWERTSLIALGFMAVPQCLGRIIAAALAGEVSHYTAIAMAYEVPIAALTLFFLTRPRRSW